MFFNLRTRWPGGASRRHIALFPRPSSSRGSLGSYGPGRGGSRCLAALLLALSGSIAAIVAGPADSARTDSYHPAPPGAGPSRSPNSPDEPAPRRIQLAGMLVLSNRQVAYVLVEEPGGRSQTYVLPSGQTKDGLRVLSINPASRTVEMLDRGQYRVLSFDSDRPSQVSPVHFQEQRFVRDHVEAHERRQAEERRIEEEELNRQPRKGIETYGNE